MVTARITAFNPGASPPPVTTPILRFCVFDLSDLLFFFIFFAGLLCGWLLFCPCGSGGIRTIGSLDNEAVVTASASVFLILLQAKDQPNLSALRANLEALLQDLSPAPVLFFVVHSLSSANARCAASRN
jgi:hypothetical protein